MISNSIVIADDDPSIRGLLVEALEDEGYVVSAYGDGLSALAEVRRAAPALVILDVAMPAMTGDETLRQLRAEGFDGPILMATAGTQPACLLGEGATQVLAKPFDLQVLLEVVARLTAPSPPLHALAAGDGRPRWRSSLSDRQ